MRLEDNEPEASIATESPTPIGGPAVETPSPSPEAATSAEAKIDEPTATPKKAEKTARSEEPKKAPTPEKSDSPRAEVEVQGHEKRAAGYTRPAGLSETESTAQADGQSDAGRRHDSHSA